MNILVTGGAGFIGSSLIEELIKKGNRIVAIDNFNNYYNPRFKKENVKGIKSKRFEIVKGDITRLSDLRRLFKKNKFDKIVHLAALAGVRNSIDHPASYFKTNLQGTLNMLEMARKFDVKDFIFAGTSAVYGNDTPSPSSEDAPCLKPLNPYAASKRAAELLCYTYHELYGLNVTILRFFTVYGPKGRPDMSIYIFTEALLKDRKIKIFGDGTQVRDFTYIGDIVSGVVAAVGKPFAFEIINLGGARPVRILKLVADLEEITGIKAKIDFRPVMAGESRTTGANVTKAKRLLGFKPKTGLKKGLAEFVKWYRLNRLD